MVLGFVLLFGCFVLGKLARIGPYIAEVNSLLQYSPPQPEEVDFFFYIQQINISHRIIEGKMTVHQPIGPLTAHFVTRTRSQHEYMATARKGITAPACVTPMIRGIVWAFSPQEGLDKETCVFKPGEYTLSDLDFNNILHIGRKTAPFGQSLFILNFRGLDQKPLFGFHFHIEIKSLEMFEYENGRGEAYRDRQH